MSDITLTDNHPSFHKSEWVKFIHTGTTQQQGYTFVKRLHGKVETAWSVDYFIDLTQLKDRMMTKRRANPDEEAKRLRVKEIPKAVKEYYRTVGARVDTKSE